ncbi:MAG: pyruvate kinase [Gemmataceae bacterium]
MTHRRTRIVATLGPATDRPGVLAALIAAGLDVARVNCSHGDAAEHLGRVARLREAADAAGRAVAVLADLPGPKLRVRLDQPRTLEAGDEVTFAADPAGSEIAVTEPVCLGDVRPGHRILLDDGRLQLKAERVSGGRLTAVVTVGGTLQPNKGVNLPDGPLSIPAVTDRDRKALEVAARAGADWLALSFVRSPTAANELRAAAKDVGLDVPVLAKVERPEAVARAAAIVAAFDGIMVARGDLGVEMPLEKVPLIQKQLIAEARFAGKPVVTATDMLDSMRTNPRPTRAEAGDVANAIYDGTDAVMLSGETAVGAYPVEAVACMDRIARETEDHLAGRDSGPTLFGPADEGVSATVCHLAGVVGADAIVVPTLSGRTARHVARHRPRAVIVAPVPSAAVRRRLAIVWGVRPVPLPDDLPRGSDRIEAAVRAAFAAGALAAGQKAIVSAGHPVECGPHLPTIRVVRVGSAGQSVEP